jgi:hypothetical protein
MQNLIDLGTQLGQAPGRKDVRDHDVTVLVEKPFVGFKSLGIDGHGCDLSSRSLLNR